MSDPGDRKAMGFSENFSDSKVCPSNDLRFGRSETQCGLHCRFARLDYDAEFGRAPTELGRVASSGPNEFRPERVPVGRSFGGHGGVANRCWWLALGLLLACSKCNARMITADGRRERHPDWVLPLGWML